MKPNKLESEIVDLLIPRLKDEFTAFYHYRALSNWCQNVGYFEAAKFFKEESDTELTHAQLIEKYLLDWNVTPNLPEFDGPKLEYKNLGEGIEASYKIEFSLYTEYEDTAAKVMKLGDVCTFNFLLQFNKIQQESVAEYSDMVNLLESVEPTKFNYLLLEKKLFN